MEKQRKKYEILSGSTLKLIALITMFIDHAGAILLSQMKFAVTPFFVLSSEKISLYYIFRLIGRTAFPIFCFLIVAGFIHTKNTKKYGRNLFIFALISEIPWNLVHTGTVFCESQNVFFTLFLGWLALYCIQNFSENKVKLLLSLLFVVISGILLNSDYGLYGVGLIIALYLAKNNRIIQGVVGCCFFSKPWKVIPAFAMINLYNGERGFIRSKTAKYIFYAAYPVHFIILFIIRSLCFGYN